jgi:two-component system, OmpR family, sensor histidine kinase KdpD
VIRNPPIPGGGVDPVEVLAGQAAQEIGSALTAIQVATERLERTWPQRDGHAAPELSVIREQSSRLARLARHLIDLAQPPMVTPVPVDLVSQFQRMLPALQRVLSREGVELRVEGLETFPSGLWVHVDPQQFQDILLVLISNARRALATSLPPRWIRLVLWPLERSEIQIRVSDSGPGVPAGSDERIFHPFVSTWGGAGMGLSRSRLSLAGQRGELTFERSPSGETAFVLTLETCNPDVA